MLPDRKFRIIPFISFLFHEEKHLIGDISSFRLRRLERVSTPTWQRESPAKTPYILDLVAHISKTNSVTPLLNCCKVIRRSRLSFWESFKKILSRGFRATIKNQEIKVALNPLDRIFKNFSESLIMPF